nr:polyketide synthase [uncultured Cupriavidus sp.]
MKYAEHELSIRGNAIAVVGLACRFPASPDAAAFWRNLRDGVECSRTFDRDSLHAAGIDAAQIDDPSYVPMAAPIDAPDQFDAALFGYSRADAEMLDPQQRLFLQAAWHALEDAGHAPGNELCRTGVFAACRLSTYPALAMFRDAGPSQVRGMQALLGNDKDYLATRTAHKLGLTGPALTVQTACSSSLVAVHLACASLQAGECDMALAGGVALSFPMGVGYLYQPGMIFSPDGKCRPFDAAAQGTYAGHGLGIVVLRRLAEAIDDGDTIYAVLRGSAINNDGNRKVGFTAPSVAGQREVVQEAMNMAGVHADDIDLIEAHGTATPLGDPIEIEALRGALAGRDRHAPRCRIGSVKGNVGHLDTAAGIASLIKTILAIHHGTIPPSLNFQTPNPTLRIDDSPFTVVTRPEPWPRPVRTAGVSSFGIGGTNCHVIVQSAHVPARRTVADDDPNDPTLLLSAASEPALRKLAGAYADTWKSGAKPAGLAATALHGRALDLEYRLALRLSDQALPALQAFANGGSDAMLRTGRGRGRQLWLFGGQGTQWPGMSAAPARHSSAFTRMLDRCCAACDPHLPLPLRAVMDGVHPMAATALADMTFAQPAIVAFELAMASHWQDLGLQPDAVLGHSVGEYAAAVVAGFYAPEDILPLVVTRGRLMQVHASAGAMLAVFADHGTLAPHIASHAVEVAAWNGARHIVLTGMAANIDRLASTLDTDGIGHARLAVPGAAHSGLLDPMLDTFENAARSLRAGPGNGVVLWSTLLGETVETDTLNRPDYWRRHVREPVLYHQSLDRALDDGVTICLELGPDAPLTGMGQRVETARTPRDEIPACQWIASARRGQDSADLLDDALRSVFAGGATLPWSRLLPCDAARVAAPQYPFDTARYWFDGGGSDGKRSNTGAGGNNGWAATDAALKAGRQAAVSGASSVDLARLATLEHCATVLHAIYVDAMVRECVGNDIDAGVTLLDILRRGRLLPRYRQLLARMLRSCVADGYYRCDADGRYVACGTMPHADRQQLLQTLRACCEGYDVIADTIARAAGQLYGAMRGDVDPVAVIFPDSDESGVEALYRDLSFGHYFNQIAAATTAGLASAHRAREFRVLEVGGGTGGTTALLLDKLAAHAGVHYTFTDISAVFTRRAQTKFARFGFVDYRELDLQKDAAAQGFDAGQYDLIVAANVIHATQDVARTLAMLGTLLRPGGHLLMREITRPMRLFDFVFGPLVAPLHDEAMRGGELFLDTDQWVAQCREAGFAQTCWLPEDGTATATMSEHIVLARAAAAADAADADDRWAALPPPRCAPDTRFRRNWREIARPVERADVADLYLVDAIDVPASALATLAEPLRAMLARSTDCAGRALTIVTRNAWAPRGTESVWPAHQAIWALLRVAVAEQPQRALAVIDIPDTDDGSALALGRAAVAAGEQWVVVRDDTVFTPVLEMAPAHATVFAPDWASGTGWHVVTGAFGGLGRVACAWLAMHGATRIAMLAPRESDHDDNGNAWCERLSAQYGCTLRWLPCDTADAAQVASCIATLHADGGIIGAIHAAAVIDDTPLAQLTPARIAAVTDVKAAGADALRDALQAHGGRYLLLYSSAAATLGSPGQGAYALACGYLDGMAEQAAPAPHALNDSSNGMAIISLVWGAWGETGRAAEPGLQQRLARTGMGTLTTAEGRWHLEQAMNGGAATHIAMRLTGAHPLLEPANGTMRDQRSRVANAKARSDEDMAPTITGQRDIDRLAIEAWLRKRIAAQLRMDDPARLQPRQDLLQLGLDSLQFLELGGAVQRAIGIRLDAARAYRDMTLAGLSILLAEAVADSGILSAKAPSSPALVPDLANRHAPFPLTPIQHAYWLGRTGLIGQGGMACHVLFEWDLDSPVEGGAGADGFDVARFEHAWNALIARHDMLRTVVGADGMQRVLPEVPQYRVEIATLEDRSANERARNLRDIRRSMAGAVPSASEWPVFDVRVTRLAGGRVRLHMNLDLLQFDVQSLKVMMDDLAAAYAGETLQPLDMTFRDYVMAGQAQRATPAWQASWRYWQGVIHTLPPAPQLPLADTVLDGPPHVTTRQGRIDARAWSRLRELWRSWGVTPSAGLLTVFARVLARASRRPDFTLNLTFFDRQPLHADVNRLIGDFTSVILLDFDIDNDTPLRDLIGQTQEALWERLAHRGVNGVEVLRSYVRTHADTGAPHRQPAMPVVFTSMLGMTLDGQPIGQALSQWLGEPVHVSTQTPQVWLDHQVMEINGDLVYHWYCMDEVLAPGLAEDLFADYMQALHAIAAHPDCQSTPHGLPAVAWHRHATALPRRSWPGAWPAGLDLRDVETHLRRHAGVCRAEIRDNADGQCPLAWIVASDASDTPPELASRHAAIDTAALPMIDGASLADYECAWQALEHRARAGIVATLHRHGLFMAPGDAHTLASVMERLGATPSRAGLVRQWLERLSADGTLAFDGGRFRALPQASPRILPPIATPDAPWFRTISQYLDRCVATHDALLAGRASALELMLGDNDLVAQAFYRDNPVSAALNDAVRVVVASLGSGRNDLRILEVGAGIGATTGALMPALGAQIDLYHFTDVSRLFLDQARRRFGDAHPMQYGILDLNRPVDFSVHPPQGYDLVIAANVVHDAVDATRSLQRLRRLLRAGGHLVLVEATTRDSFLQRASIGFMETLNGLEDARAIDNNPMLDLPGWTTTLHDAGLATVLTWPEPGNPDWRQHLILARAELPGRLDMSDLSAHLRAAFADFPALRWRQCERLPEPDPAVHSESGTKTGAALAESPGTDAMADPALVRAVGAVWETLLAGPAHDDTDFFRSGGDSLIATRMVARINHLGLAPATLQQIFEHPRLADFCAAMSETASRETADTHVVAHGERPGNVFACHASDGGVAAYLPLAHAIGHTVHGLDAEGALSAATLGALARRHLATLRRIQPRGPYTVLGWSYGTFLAAEVARRLHETGEAVRVVLIDPVCRADFDCASHGAMLRLLCQGPARLEPPEAFDHWTAAAQDNWFLSQARAAGSWPAGAEGMQRLELVAHLMSLLALAPQPVPLPVPCLRIDARQRPSQWRPAEHDWNGWSAGDERPHIRQHCLEANHWDLVTDTGCAARVAALWHAWDADCGVTS